jgi:hypothetical protein
MKTFTIIAAMLLSISSIVATAKVITVSNNPSSGGQYTDIQSAITAASVNDTIYVSGSAITYAAATINKRITLIGAGYANTGTPYSMNTLINGLTIDSVAFSTDPVNGAHIISISSSITGNYSKPIKNIHIERCYCSSITYTGDGWIIENSVVGSINVYQSNGIINSCIIRNNFITSTISGNGQMNAPGLVIDHNIIQGQINYISFASISSNIFFYANIAASYYCLSNTFNNNITVYSTFDVLPFGSNTGTGNLNNQNPTTVFSNGLTNYTYYPNLLSYDWHLKATSPGHNAGKDNTDIGMYGGVKPMPNMTGISTLPLMTLLNISSTFIPEGGTLNYEFKARKN